ncbi:MAG: hypothetical protein J2P17_23765 [Mycobacterium sp.]|nr:hypothetical protein [Mycobacterium sp.]
MSGRAEIWMHSRKGRIAGEVVRQDDEWMWVRLAGNHALRYMSEFNRGLVHADGEVLCLRRSLMRKLTPAAALPEGEAQS